MGGVFTKLIESNTTIPTKKSQVFSTAVDNQPSVEIHVLQGERAMAKDNKTIGRFHLDGIPPAGRGIPQIEVTFDIDANGIIKVSAMDKGTNKQQSIRIESSTGLSKEDIEKMKSEAEANAEEDKKIREEVEVMNQADSLVFQIEKSIKEFDEKITIDQKEKVVDNLTELKDHIANRDIQKVKVAMETLQTTFNEIMQSVYSQTTEQPQDDGMDVEFEEVKTEE
jgi:molecular chaperone DnaK